MENLNALFLPLLFCEDNHHSRYFFVIIERTTVLHQICRWYAFLWVVYLWNKVFTSLWWKFLPWTKKLKHNFYQYILSMIKPMDEIPSRSDALQDEWSFFKTFSSSKDLTLLVSKTKNYMIYLIQYLHMNFCRYCDILK